MRLQGRVRVAMAILLATGVSCGGFAPVRWQGLQDEETAGPVWPEPPAPARVAWQGAYEARSDGYIRPHGLGLAADGSLCVADPPSRIVWRQDAEGRTKRVGEDDLRLPVDCAFLPDGSLMVADSMLGRVLIFDQRRRLVGESASEAFERPVSLAVDAKRGRVIAADSSAHRLVVLSFEGTVQATIGRRGTAPGEFNYPVAVTLGDGGRIIVVDSMNFRVQILDSEGRPITAFGVAGDGPGTFSRPRGVAVDGQGNIWVADALFDNVQIFDRRGRLLLAVGSQGRGRGEFWMPADVVAAGGRVLVADAYNRRVQAFELLATGATTP